jgi:hypothetical protein
MIPVKLATRVLQLVGAAFLAVPGYVGLAYVVLPLSWKGYERLARPVGGAGCTRTAEDIPGDPLNVAFVGSREDVEAALLAARWAPADPITWRSAWRDATSVVFDRPYATAPVSTHFLFGRAQDLAFERIEGRSPRRRHHVRLWRVSERFWIGAATFDRSLGVSRRTGEVMHHIEENVDAERATVFEDLSRGGRLRRIETSAGPRPPGGGRNGGGDRFITDGALWTGVLESARRDPAAGDPPAVF